MVKIVPRKKTISVSNPSVKESGDSPADVAATGQKKVSLSEKIKNSNGKADSSYLRYLGTLDTEDFLEGVGKRTSERMNEDKSVPTPFPTQVFPTDLKRFVEDSSKSLPCPPDYIGMAVLATTSYFIGSGRPIEVKSGWKELAVIYGVTVGHTGSRKTPALELGMGPIREKDSQLALEYEEAKKEYREIEEKCKKSKQVNKESPPLPKQSITVDTTIEALADVLNCNPRGVLLYRDEMTGLMASMNQYKAGKGSDKQFFLTAWSSQDFTVNRKGKEPQRIAKPYLSIIGNIPPDMLGDLADSRGREDGFIDRFLFSYPTPIQVKWTDTYPDPILYDKYIQASLAIGGLLDHTLTLTKLSGNIFSHWYDEHNREKDGPSGSWAKMDGYCARLASIIHHLRYAYGETRYCNKVDEVSVRNAIILIDYFKNHARRALGSMRVGKEKTKLARLLAFVIHSEEYRVRPGNLIAAQIAKNAVEGKEMLQQLISLNLGKLIPGRQANEFIFQGRSDLATLSEGLESL
jgi:uncharacterized protein DUF3987